MRRSAWKTKSFIKEKVMRDGENEVHAIAICKVPMIQLNLKYKRAFLMASLASKVGILSIGFKSQCMRLNSGNQPLIGNQRPRLSALRKKRHQYVDSLKTDINDANFT